MSFKDIQKRTAKRKAAGVTKTYPKHAPKPVRAAKPKRVALPMAPCVHEGQILTPCHSCGSAQRHVRDCEIHGTCTRIDAGKEVDQVCATCPDYDSGSGSGSGSGQGRVSAQPNELNPPPDRYPPVGRRHLVYYVLPVSGNGVWQRGVDALRLRWPLFTGKKIVAVATGGPVRERIDPREGLNDRTRALPLDPVEMVRAYLPSDAEVITVPNDPKQWERVAWRPLWDTVLAGADDTDAVLYAHAKGVTRRPASPCHRWADLLYTLALDHWPETEDQLRRHPIAGSLVKRGSFFAAPSAASRWHYSGNFFWVRARDARDKVASVLVPLDRWGAEAWPGIAFGLDQAGEVMRPSDPDFYLYDPAHLDRVLADHARWAVTHRPAPFLSPVGACQKSGGVRLSIIVPTVGRGSLGRTLGSITPQLLPGDELIVQPDRSGDWGATPRTRGQRAATGDYLLWMDDDDVYVPGALTAVRQALAQAPGRPHLFRMRRGSPFSDVLPRSRVVQVGEVSTQMLVLPNDPTRMGEWGTRYEGDFDFIASTLALWPADALVWRDEVIAVWRPETVKDG